MKRWLPRTRPIGAELQLDVGKIIETVTGLRSRIEERFPGSGLGSLADRLHDIASHSVEDLEWVGRPLLPLRIAIGLCVLLILALPVWLISSAEFPAGAPDLLVLLEALESGVNDLIFLGFILFFLFTLESRIKRNRALRSLHNLRAAAHIIDMHQLTKDPDRLAHEGVDARATPQEGLDQFLLGRYLDYCSEMLSLVSKIAALYAQRLADPVVLAAVDEVEALTTGLSSKIWQKLMILDWSLNAAREEGGYRG